MGRRRGWPFIVVGTVAVGCGLDVFGVAAGDNLGPDASLLDAQAAGDAQLPDAIRQQVSATERVRRGLIALYTFDGPDAAVVEDVSGVMPRLDLITAHGIVLIDGGIEIADSGRLTTGQPATKIVNAAVQSDELTVEAWITPLTPGQIAEGPARIVTLSRDPEHRDFTLGMNDAGYVFRLRTDTSGQNGMLNGGEINVLPAPEVGRLTHVVFVREKQGGRRLSVNDVERTLDPLDGSLDNWDPNLRLSVGNELTDDRIWRGRIHLVAIYGRALETTEVHQNFRAGP